MRDKPSQGVKLFQREWWPERLAQTSLRLRLFCREIEGRDPWQGGFTEAERAALETIAGGGRVEGLELNSRLAANLLSASWLR